MHGTCSIHHTFRSGCSWTQKKKRIQAHGQFWVLSVLANVFSVSVCSLWSSMASSFLHQEKSFSADRRHCRWLLLAMEFHGLSVFCTRFKLGVGRFANAVLHSTPSPMIRDSGVGAHLLLTSYAVSVPRASTVLLFSART